MAEVLTLDIDDAVIATLEPRFTHEDLKANGIALGIIASRKQAGTQHDIFLGRTGAIASGHLMGIYRKGAN